MKLNGRVIRKIQLTDLAISLYPIFPLHICTKFIADLYHKKPLGSSKNLALDERSSTNTFQKM